MRPLKYQERMTRFEMKIPGTTKEAAQNRAAELEYKGGLSEYVLALIFADLREAAREVPPTPKQEV